jgi:hypothetical protein
MSIFRDPAFDFGHRLTGYGDDFGFSFEDNPEKMTACTLRLVERFAAAAGLELALEPLPGMWSGKSAGWVSTQDIVVLKK